MDSLPEFQKPFASYTSIPTTERPPTASKIDPLSPSSLSKNASPSSSHHAPATATSGSTHAATTRIRRRNRIITSCLECRRRKLKCDKSYPCINCTKFRRDCIFLSKDMDPASQLKLTEIKEKVGSLEKLLERDITRPISAAESAELDPGDAVKVEEGAGLGIEDESLPEAEDERGLKPSPLAVVDVAYEEGDEADDDLLDLGIKIGRMRITERIGGFVRPKFAQELSHTLNESSAQETAESESSPLPAHNFFTSPNYEFLKPGPSYIAPASGFFFGQGSDSHSLIDFLPSRLAADRLIKQYFDAVHPIARILHRPTFERDYEAFWEEVSIGLEPPPSLQTIVFAAMFSGAVSMDDTVISRDFGGCTKKSLVENFKIGTETALGRAHFLRTTKVATLQGFVMYLIPLCREEISRAHSVLVGAAIRMGECLGLHRDGEHYGLNPLETHVRRLIWYQLCFLDIRTCEAQGPRPSIRKEDGDTKLPGNYDDIDLHAYGPPPAITERWTDMTFSLMRFECNEMFRTIWVDRGRVETRKITLTALLAKAETFRKKMAEKYDHLIDERIPLQRCAKFTKGLLLSRLNIMILHRYHNSTSMDMPARLRKLLISSSVHATEAAMALDIIPDLLPWRWYMGAYTQYHQAILLLVDTFFYGHAVEADRIWPCLDFVFNTDQTIPREERGRTILQEIRTKANIYADRRKIRAPEGMDKVVAQHSQRRSSRPRGEESSSATAGRAKTSMPIGPPDGAVFAGVSNGEALWAFPNQQAHSSPASSSDATHSRINSVSQTEGLQGLGGAPASVVPGQDTLMAEIDWEAFDALFPPDQNVVDMYSPGFSALTFSY